MIVMVNFKKYQQVETKHYTLQGGIMNFIECVTLTLYQHFPAFTSHDIDNTELLMYSVPTCCVTKSFMTGGEVALCTVQR